MNQAVLLHPQEQGQAGLYPGLALPVEALSEGFVSHVPSVPEGGEAASGMSEVLAAQMAIASSVGDVQWSSGRQQRQGFVVDGLRLMMGYEDGSELVDLPDVSWMPNAPDWLLGVVNLHGVLVPAVDLGVYWGMRPVGRDVHRPMLLVLGHGTGAAGIVIHQLPQRLSWDVADGNVLSMDFAPERLHPLLKEIRVINGAIWLDLKVSVLLDVLETGFEAGRGRVLAGL